MFNSFAIVSLLTSAAFAQSTSPLIPESAGATCKQFLQTLDSDSSISSCLKPLLTVAQAYGPNGDASNVTASSIQSDLQSLCSSTSSACSESTFRTLLASFQDSCSDELTTKFDKPTIYTYDMVYSFIPFSQAVCTKDDNSGSYCVTKTSSIVNTTSDSSKSLLSIAKQYLWETSAQALSKRADDIAAPNATTFSSTNVLFLFRTPSLSYNQLCTPCTRNIATKWVSFLSNVPYAPALDNSVLLATWNQLYTGIQGTCGPNFLQQGVQAAGGLSGDKFSSNGSFKTIAIGMQGFITLVFGIFTSFIATAL